MMLVFIGPGHVNPLTKAALAAELDIHEIVELSPSTDITDLSLFLAAIPKADYALVDWPSPLELTLIIALQQKGVKVLWYKTIGPGNPYIQGVNIKNPCSGFYVLPDLIQLTADGTANGHGAATACIVSDGKVQTKTKAALAAELGAAKVIVIQPPQIDPHDIAGPTVAFVQSLPKTDYVFFDWHSPAAFLAATLLQAAGVKIVHPKIFGHGDDPHVGNAYWGFITLPNVNGIQKEVP